MSAPVMRPEPAERLIFPSAIEALVTHALRGQVSPRLRGLLRAEGIDLDRPLRPAYPTGPWMRCLKHIVADVFPELPLEEGFRALGGRTLDGYRETMFGRALLASMRLFGPRRMIGRLPKDIRAADNYTNVVVTEVEPTHFELWFNWENETPGYIEGLFTALMLACGAKDPQVSLVSTTGAETVYRIRWEPGA
jgi:uncharacterized protein (TIGR02265 family)